MPELKLYYFHPGNRVLVSRLVLAVANVDYEFVQVERNTWRELKSTFVFGQLPVLEINGKRYGQSLAIQAYLASEYGLYGSNKIHQLEINQIAELREDLSRESHRQRDSDPAKQIEREKHLKENVLPRYLGFFTKFLNENATGFAVGDKLSLADLIIYEAITSLPKAHSDLLQNYPEIVAHKEKIEHIPAIKQYLDSRSEPKST